MTLCKKALFAVFCVCATVWHLGCVSPNGFPKEMSYALTKAVDKVADQGMLDTWKTNLRGHINDPGVESYATVTIAAGVRLTGVDGDMNFDSGGGATKLPPGVREELIKQLDGPLSDEQRANILGLLGWNRTAAAVTPGQAERAELREWNVGVAAMSKASAEKMVPP